jgi:hypothetical protein
MQSEIKRVEDVMDERHDLYKERSDAAKEQVGIAFTASEKAATKTEQAQDLYNKGHNDLLRKMDDQHKDTLPREEANAKFESMAREIQSLRESRVETSSLAVQSAKDTEEAQRRKTNADRTTLAIAALVIGLMVAGFNFVTRSNPPAVPVVNVAPTPAPTR